MFPDIKEQLKDSIEQYRISYIFNGRAYKKNPST